ncbi:uncharacterized protein SPSK_07110 [Sporothrix schenckii 1099-18]|uniref:Uncharacterized protein n=1 Tax=Sporothrix schenckii 1099-18 TaxID=1397361 RepID=A0A0F2ML45_SPOSC|nr:uncharacterized protein SPSK_07110 [Sporothrix schenckii 1099-18]KJR88911.1 hypothetical protein SPSK_07110 [Sporothrix schenckii 1099-18]
MVQSVIVNGSSDRFLVPPADGVNNGPYVRVSDGDDGGYAGHADYAGHDRPRRKRPTRRSGVTRRKRMKEIRVQQNALDEDRCEILTGLDRLQHQRHRIYEAEEDLNTTLAVIQATKERIDSRYWHQVSERIRAQGVEARKAQNSVPARPTSSHAAPLNPTAPIFVVPSRGPMPSNKPWNPLAADFVPRPRTAPLPSTNDFVPPQPIVVRTTSPLTFDVEPRGKPIVRLPPIRLPMVHLPDVRPAPSPGPGPVIWAVPVARNPNASPLRRSPSCASLVTRTASIVPCAPSTLRRSASFDRSATPIDLSAFTKLKREAPPKTVTATVTAPSKAAVKALSVPSFSRKAVSSVTSAASPSPSPSVSRRGSVGSVGSVGSNTGAVVSLRKMATTSAAVAVAVAASASASRAGSPAVSRRASVSSAGGGGDPRGAGFAASLRLAAGTSRSWSVSPFLVPSTSGSAMRRSSSTPGEASSTLSSRRQPLPSRESSRESSRASSRAPSRAPSRTPSCTPPQAPHASPRLHPIRQPRNPPAVSARVPPPTRTVANWTPWMSNTHSQSSSMASSASSSPLVRAASPSTNATHFRRAVVKSTATQGRVATASTSISPVVDTSALSQVAALHRAALAALTLAPEAAQEHDQDEDEALEMEMGHKKGRPVLEASSPPPPSPPTAVAVPSPSLLHTNKMASTNTPGTPSLLRTSMTQSPIQDSLVSLASIPALDLNAPVAGDTPTSLPPPPTTTRRGRTASLAAAANTDKDGVEAPPNTPSIAKFFSKLLHRDGKRP